jgi:hypothetical protein
LYSFLLVWVIASNVDDDEIRRGIEEEKKKFKRIMIKKIGESLRDEIPYFSYM